MARRRGESGADLRATLPAVIASHSTEQDFYFGPDMLHPPARLQGRNRRSNFPAAQYISDPVSIDGIKIPTRRRVYLRDDNLMPMRRYADGVDRSRLTFRFN